MDLLAKSIRDVDTCIWRHVNRDHDFVRLQLRQDIYVQLDVVWVVARESEQLSKCLHSSRARLFQEPFADAHRASRRFVEFSRHESEQTVDILRPS